MKKDMMSGVTVGSGK